MQIYLNAILFLSLFLFRLGPLSLFFFLSLFSSLRPKPNRPFSFSSLPARPRTAGLFPSSPSTARSLLLFPQPSPPARQLPSSPPSLTLTGGTCLSGSSPTSSSSRARTCVESGRGTASPPRDTGARTPRPRPPYLKRRPCPRLHITCSHRLSPSKP
jgi:hypothetical protein